MALQRSIYFLTTQALKPSTPSTGSKRGRTCQTKYIHTPAPTNHIENIAQVPTDCKTRIWRQSTQSSLMKRYIFHQTQIHRMSLFSGLEWTTGLLEWTTGTLEWTTGILEWITGMATYLTRCSLGGKAVLIS